MLKSMIIAELKKQKENMSIPYEAIASRSNVGIATVKRAFSGKTISFDTLEKIAMALECEISIKPKISAKKLYNEQIEKKAHVIVERVMRTSALEDQKPGSNTYNAMLRQAKNTIRKMPTSQIWA